MGQLKKSYSAPTVQSLPLPPAMHRLNSETLCALVDAAMVHMHAVSAQDEHGHVTHVDVDEHDALVLQNKLTTLSAAIGEAMKGEHR